MMFQLKNNTATLFVFMVAFVLQLGSCTQPKGVLNQTEMANILTEMHKTDATLTERGLLYGNYSFKAPYYNYIFSKHHISQAQFDSSLVWYSKNPQKFENLYENVISQLTDLQKNVANNYYHPIDLDEIGKVREDLWNKAPKFIFTKDSVRTKLEFEIKNDNLLYRDVYLLKMLLYAAPEDSCKNRHIVLNINYFNGKTDTKIEKIYNDGITRRYTFTMFAHRKLKIKSISGQLLASKSFNGVFHTSIDSIKLIREFKPMQADSLRKIIQAADTTHYKGSAHFDIQAEPKPTRTFKNSRILKPV